MCTLIVLDRVVAGLPLVVASNRDEFLSRAAAPPARVGPDKGRGSAFVAPQDLAAGGTWMGVNTEGLFVGLTNRRGRNAAGAAGEAPEDRGRSPRRRSRGLLVREALGYPGAEEWVGRMRPGVSDELERSYEPFHLYLGDGRRSFLVRRGDEGVELDELAPGIHVITNTDAADPESRKAPRLRAQLGDIDLEAPIQRIFRSLAAVLRGHSGSEDPLEHACVHTPGYGTRSSALLALGPKRWRYLHAEGPPCQEKYLNYSRLLEALRPASTPC